ncbi:hypothetical protein [Streptomyces sp. UG1]|uniref:hypothetical protein n=1 Tax=Streptomyces sp. UG1 TaxID=3417652 RepID=UPI003CEDE529
MCRRTSTTTPTCTRPTPRTPTAPPPAAAPASAAASTRCRHQRRRPRRTRDNLAQLTDFIATHSAGNAVVVMGDTNTRYTRYTRSGDTIAEFAAAGGLTDAWGQLIRGGSAPAKGSDALVCDQTGTTVPNTCEVVDKILYRGSKLVTLNATPYNNEHSKFLTDDGLMLSDHDPITAGFTWSRNAAFQLSDQFSGPHGDYYNDIDSVPAGARATTIALRAGSRVDQLSLTLSNGTTLAHGGTGGTTTSDCVTRTAPSGWQIAGFHGRSGDEVDKVGFIYTQR